MSCCGNNQIEPEEEVRQVVVVVVVMVVVLAVVAVVGRLLRLDSLLFGGGKFWT